MVFNDSRNKMRRSIEMISEKLDYYLVKAVKEELIDTDKQFLVLTDAGEKVMTEISIACFKLIDESNDSKDFITSAAKVISEASGKDYPAMVLFKEIML